MPTPSQAASAAPIEEIITQQVGPVISKIVVAVALTNVLACILANILVATRLTYSMARDNMLPFSHVWRHVSPSNRTPTYAVLGIFGFSTILLLSALVSEKAFFLILGLSSLAVCSMYLLQTIALMIATAAEPSRRPSRERSTSAGSRAGATSSRPDRASPWCARR